MAECWSALRTVTAFSFIINILMLATPLFMLQVMDRVLRSGHVETLVLLAIIACGAMPAAPRIPIAVVTKSLPS